MKPTKKENYYDVAGNQCSYRLSYNEVENELIIRLEDTEPCVVPSKVYESKFTLEQLQKLSKYFKMCDSITEAKTLILQIIEEKKFDVVNEKEKLKLLLTLPVMIAENKIGLDIMKVTKNQSDVVNELCGSLQKLLIDFPKLEKETKELESDMKKMKEIIEKRKIEVAKMNDVPQSEVIKQ